MYDKPSTIEISSGSDWYDQFKRDLFVFVLVFAVLLFALPWLRFQLSLGLDDTDGPTHLSGMQPYTDARTGCQYLGTGFSALTPRLDASGKPMCGAPAKVSP